MRICWKVDIFAKIVKMTLREYIETEIIPRYDAFDGAHRRDHVGYVIDESLKLAEHYGLDRNMVYTVAAYHDTGLAVDRKTHHLESGRILRSDELLKRWLSPSDRFPHHYPSYHKLRPLPLSGT